MTPGTVIDSRFEVVASVGRGGGGRVFSGRDLNDGSPVAIKILDPRASRASRFTREASLLTEITHPGIVRYIAHGISGERRYLITEWVSGPTLSEQLDRGLTMRESVAVVARVADTLASVHELGIVHRDIKPSNIILPDGDVDRAKLLDFGIARRLGRGRGPTKTGVLLGTPGYMSPEQALRAHGVDAQTDVFSLGCVLYACLSGQPPFAAVHLLTTLTAVLFFDPIPLAELCPEAPPTLIDLVERMMAKAKEERPAGVDEVVRALAALPSVPDTAPRLPRSNTSAPCAPETDSTGPDTLTTQASGQSPTKIANEPPPLFILAALGGAPSGVDAAASTDGRAQPTLDEHVRPVRELVTENRGLSAVLADGTFVAMFGAELDPSEQASRAAACALHLRQLAPAAPMVIGRGDRAPISGVLDRLVEILIHESFRALLSDDAANADAKAIRLDAGTASLLPDEFEVQRDDSVDYLQPRRRAQTARDLSR